MNDIQITGFRQVPDFARGLVRDLRLRWTLNELGKRYDVQLIEQAERGDPAFLAVQPFGLVPSMNADGDSVFESGAIVFLLAEGTSLAGQSQRERNQTLVWIFAALNTVEPYITLLFANDHGRTDKPWTITARPDIVDVIERRLGVLEERLSRQDYLIGTFSAADIMMITTLRFLHYTDVLDNYPALAAYIARCEGRPAFQQALDGQLNDFEPAPVAA